jgi:hypothetical protein
MQREMDPDVAWVEALAGATRPAAERAIEEAGREDRLFRSIAEEHAKEGRVSYIEIDAPLELHALVRLRKPRHVVEVGVSSGVSSAYLLQALERNGVGTLHSVDLPKLDRTTGSAPPKHSWSLPKGRATGWAVPFSLRKRWDLRLGDKQQVLPLLAAELPRIDLVVYDVPHEDSATFREFLALDGRFRTHGIAIADHGPTGGLCDGLRRWASRRGATPVRRAGLGLFGFRAGPRPP